MNYDFNTEGGKMEVLRGGRRRNIEEEYRGGI